MPRVGEDEDHELDPRIALPERDAPIERLPVVDMDDGFDARRPAELGKDAIPGTWIAGRPDRGLRSSGERRCHERPKASEEPNLTGIADPNPARERPNRKVEPNGNSDPGRKFDREIPDQAALDSAEVPVRDAHDL